MYLKLPHGGLDECHDGCSEKLGEQRLCFLFFLLPDGDKYIHTFAFLCLSDNSVL